MPGTAVCIMNCRGLGDWALAPCASESASNATRTQLPREASVRCMGSSLDDRLGVTGFYTGEPGIASNLRLPSVIRTCSCQPGMILMAVSPRLHFKKGNRCILGKVENFKGRVGGRSRVETRR